METFLLLLGIGCGIVNYGSAEILVNTKYCSESDVVIERKIIADITAYNTVQEQTDSSPCIGATGVDLCKIRENTIACPRNIPLFTRVLINGEIYTCHDRTNQKYNGRFDINFKYDVSGARKFGIKRNQEILIIK